MYYNKERSAPVVIDLRNDSGVRQVLTDRPLYLYIKTFIADCGV
ncbi:MAG: hypothetical protein E7F16_13730 [Enterococcus casseliflavus]|nr:hypothetical protein [Enterococcus casseliflavus]